MAVEVFDDDGPARARREGRARLHRALPVDAGRLLERPGRHASTAPPTSSASRRLAPRRLRRAHRRTAASIIYGRSDAVLNPGGVRIGTAEIYRAGRAARRGAGERSSIGQDWARRRARRAVRAAARRASRSTTRWRDGSATRSARTPRRATCRRRSCRSPTSRAPRAARSSSSRCARRPRPAGEEPRRARESGGARTSSDRPSSQDVKAAALYQRECARLALPAPTPRSAQVVQLLDELQRELIAGRSRKRAARATSCWASSPPRGKLRRCSAACTSGAASAAARPC